MTNNQENMDEDDKIIENMLKDFRTRSIESLSLSMFGFILVTIAFINNKDIFTFIVGTIGIILGSLRYFGGNYLRYGKIIVNLQDINKFLLDESKSFKSNILEVTDNYSIEEINLIKLTNTCKQRLQKEIINLNRKGRMNLFIGIITTSIGAIILCYIAFYTYEVNDDIRVYFIHLITKFSIIVFFEFFAFFFLRLYKITQEDIKFYQNEISNIELKTFAAMTALTSNDTSLLKPIIEQLATTERNFILKKGETTIALEREKLDRNEIIDLVRETIISTQRKSKK